MSEILKNFKKSILIFSLLTILFLLIFSFPVQAKPSSGWTKADGTTPGYDNVSNSKGISENPKIVLDSSQRPNIVWREYALFEEQCGWYIYFSKWNGSQWTKADGLTHGYDNIGPASCYFGSGDLGMPQIVLDSAQRPNIVWDGNYRIYFSKWNGSQWTKADGLTSGYDNLINSVYSYCQKMVLDSSGRPNIVWEHGSSAHEGRINYGEIFFSKWNGSQWTKADGLTPGYDNVSNTINDSTFPQIVLDSSQRPNIVWDEIEICFSKWNGSAWTKADGLTPGYDYLIGSSVVSYIQQIALDFRGIPNIIWFDWIGNGDIFLSKWNGTAWTKADEKTPGCDNISHSSGESRFPQLVFDSSGRPNIVWTYYSTTGNHENHDVFFSKWNGSAWTKADGATPGYDNVSNTHGGFCPQMILDSSQRPDIIWVNNTTGNYGIFFSKWNGSQWTRADCGTPGFGNIGLGIQIVRDSDQRPNIVWSSEIAQGQHCEILFSKWSSPAVRIDGTSRYETAVEISRRGWNSADKVILARGDDYPDALSGAAIAGKYNCPIFLTYPKSLNQSTKDEINRLGAKEVFILGSEDAIYPQVTEDLKNQCGITEDKVKRIGGTDRYDTSGLIAQKLNSPSNETVLIATGENYPDALSAAALSYSLGLPIFLVGGGKISPEIQKAFSQLKIEKIIALGGKDVVPQGYIDWFVKKGASFEKRLSGDDRYGTAREIAQYSLEKGFSSKSIYLATGENFPDALALGPLAGKGKSPILLTSKDLVRYATEYWLKENKNSIERIYIAGGTDVVSGKVEDEIKTIIGAE